MKTFTECFAAYGAKLPNAQWAVSAMADDGSLVLSCWSLYFSRPDRETLRYTDRLSRWSGNEAGNSLLRRHLEAVQQGGAPVRLVIATPVDRAIVDEGRDASTTKKTFHIKPEVTGQLTHFDGDEFVIDFRRQSP